MSHPRDENLPVFRPTPVPANTTGSPGYLYDDAAGRREWRSPSDTGGDKSYTHTQGVAATTWTVNHNLGKRVSVSIVDSGGDQCIGNVNYVNNNTVVLTFSAAFAGSAYCN